MITDFILLSQDDLARLGGPNGARTQIQRAIRSLTGVRFARYTQVVDDKQRSPFMRGTVECVAFVELDFDTASEKKAALEQIQLVGDLSLFEAVNLVVAKKVDRVAEQAELKPTSIKRVSMLGRAGNISAEQFQSEWWGLHSELVREMPGYVGYIQNLVLDRLVHGLSVPHSTVPVDGIVEFWFPDMAGFDTCYASDEFKKTAKHGAEFIQDITTYLVKTSPLEIN